VSGAGLFLARLVLLVIAICCFAIVAEYRFRILFDHWRYLAIVGTFSAAGFLALERRG